MHHNLDAPADNSPLPPLRVKPSNPRQHTNAGASQDLSKQGAQPIRLCPRPTPASAIEATSSSLTLRPKAQSRRRIAELYLEAENRDKQTQSDSAKPPPRHKLRSPKKKRGSLAPMPWEQPLADAAVERRLSGSAKGRARGTPGDSYRKALELLKGKSGGEKKARTWYGLFHE